MASSEAASTFSPKNKVQFKMLSLLLKYIVPRYRLKGTKGRSATLSSVGSLATTGDRWKQRWGSALLSALLATTFALSPQTVAYLRIVWNWPVIYKSWTQISLIRFLLSLSSSCSPSPIHGSRICVGPSLSFGCRPLLCQPLPSLCKSSPRVLQ